MTRPQNLGAAAAAAAAHSSLPFERAFQSKLLIAATHPSRSGGGGKAVASEIPELSQQSAAAAAAAPKQPKKRRLGANPTVTGRAVEIVSAGADTWCTILRHPVSFVPPKANAGRVDVKCCWEIQIAADEWVPNPRGIVNLLGRSHSTTMSVLTLLYLMGYLVNQTLGSHKVTEDGEMDPLTNRRGKATTKMVPSDSEMQITFERVPHRDDPTKFVCFRWRFRELGSPYSQHSMLHELVHLLSDNQDRKNAQMKTGAPPKFASEKYMPTCVTMQNWIKLCAYHNPHLWLDAVAAIEGGECNKVEPGDLFKDTHAFHPGKAFSIEKNLEVARRMKADPAYCDRETYLGTDQNGNRLQRWAEDGKNTWQISPGDLAPETLHQMYMPFQTQNPMSFTAEKLAWAKAYNIPKHMIEKAFNATRNHSSRMGEENDMSALTVRIADDRAELLFTHRKDKSSVHAARGGLNDDVDDAFHPALLQMSHGKWMGEFLEIINPQGNCPPAMQRITEAFATYLAANDQIFSIPQTQLFGNLSRYGNARVFDIVAISEIMTVATEQQSCLLNCYSALHVYSRIPMQCHGLFLGPPGIGKSFALLIVEQLFIPGTYRKYTIITPKALAVPGKDQACLIMIIEDGLPSLLGVSGGSGGKQSAASSDVEAIMKQFLTAMEIQIASINMDPKRTGEFIRCEAGCVVLIAMNDSSNLFPSAILDRFCVTLGAAECSSKSTDAATRMMAMSERDGSAPIKMAKLNLKVWWGRKQMAHAYIQHMESCGMIHPIDLSATDYFFGLVASFAESRGINMCSQRKLTRFRIHVRSQVVTYATDLILDTPDSPFRDIPFLVNHFLATNKYMFGTIEMAVFVMGLLSRMWQDSAYADLASTMKRKFFPDSKGRVKSYHALSPLNADGTDPVLIDLAEKHCPDVPDGYVPRRHAPYSQTAFAPGPPPSRAEPKGKKAKAAAADDGNQSKLPFASEEAGRHKKFAAYEEEKVAYDATYTERRMWMYDTCKFGSPGLPHMAHLGNRLPTRDEIIEHLAAKIGPDMEKRYLPSELRAKLVDMTTTPVIVSRLRAKPSLLADGMGDEEEEKELTDDPKTHPERFYWHKEERMQLVIENDCIRMCIPSLEHAEGAKDVIYDCVKQALTVLYAAAQKQSDASSCGFAEDKEAYASLLYGETEKESDSRHIWRMVTVDKAEAAKVDVDKYARVFNSAYASPVKKRVMRQFLRSTDPAYDDPAVLFRLYDADQPWTIMDKSPDNLAALKRAETLGLSRRDQHEVLPSNDPTVHNRAFKKHYAERGENTEIYPQGFKEHNAAYWNKKLEENPKQFQSSTQFKALFDRQAMRPSIYSASAPLPLPSMPGLEDAAGNSPVTPRAVLQDEEEYEEYQGPSAEELEVADMDQNSD